MGGKNAKKWDNYVAEIKQEYYDKLKDYIAIDNNGEYKSTKAFRLKKNGENTNIFKIIDVSNVQNEENNDEINIKF